MQNNSKQRKLQPTARALEAPSKARLERLDKARKALGWTWGELARQLGVTRKTASFWKQGLSSVPETAVALIEMRVKVRDLQK